MSSQPYQKVTVVRPYDEAIRRRVFGILEQAGLSIGERDIIAPGVSNEEVLEQLEWCRDHTLLIPFHAHRDESGKSLNGVSLYREVRDRWPHLRDNPVLMPVEDASANVVRKLLEIQGSGRVLVISANELDDPDAVAERVRDHVASSAR